MAIRKQRLVSFFMSIRSSLPSLPVGEWFANQLPKYGC
jgi:hypothetical protein